VTFGGNPSVMAPSLATSCGGGTLANGSAQVVPTWHAQVGAGSLVNGGSHMVPPQLASASRGLVPNGSAQVVQNLGPRPLGTASPLALPAPGGVRTSGVVLCVGDSLTAGQRHINDTYPHHLGKMLEDAGFGPLVVKNLGKWGEASPELVTRMPQAIAEAKGMPVAFVLVLCGTNMFCHIRRPPRSSRGCSASTSSPAPQRARLASAF